MKQLTEATLENMMEVFMHVKLCNVHSVIKFLNCTNNKSVKNKLNSLKINKQKSPIISLSCRKIQIRLWCH